MPLPEELIAEERPVATYAQPLSRLQVSWGSILAGALSLLAVSLIVWALTLAIILTATHASIASVKGALIAAWICGIVTTLIGAVVGGMVAGYLPGNPRRSIAVLHGFLAWTVAFALSAFIHGSIIAGAARTVTNAAVTTASAAVQTAGAAVGGAAGAAGAAASGPMTLQQKAVNVLESLGYPPAQAASMVANAQREVQGMLRGTPSAPVTQAQAGAQQAVTQATTQAKGALDNMLSLAAVYAWLWWGTWLVAGGLAMAGAAAVVKRTKRVPERERAFGAEPLHITTLRPARAS
jgi:MFS family permease